MVDSSCESDDDVAPESGAPATEPDIDDASTLDRIVGSRPDADFIKQTLRAQVYHETLFEYGHCVHSHSLLMSRHGRGRGAAGGNRREGAAEEQDHLAAKRYDGQKEGGSGQKEGGSGQKEGGSSQKEGGSGQKERVWLYPF